MPAWTFFGRHGAAVIVSTLILLGVAAGIARAVYPSTLAERAERLRAGLWRVVGVQEPNAIERAVQVRHLEDRFRHNKGSIALHAGVGALFLLLGSLQFIRRIRARHIHLHRLNGRFLVASSLLITLTGLYFGVVIPAAGKPEAVVITIVAVLFVVSLTMGVFAVRRKDLRRHREWMIRAFGIAVGISVVRIVALVADAMLTPRGWALTDVFVLSLVLGWGTSVVAAESWILFTRAVDRSLSQPSRHGAESERRLVSLDAP